MHCIGGACQFGELLGDGVEGPGDVEFVPAAPSAPMVTWAMEVRSAPVLEGQKLPGMLRVCVNALAVGVGAIVADKVGGVAEAACATATFMGDPPG